MSPFRDQKIRTWRRGLHMPPPLLLSSVISSKWLKKSLSLQVRNYTESTSQVTERVEWICLCRDFRKCQIHRKCFLSRADINRVGLKPVLRNYIQMHFKYVKNYSKISVLTLKQDKKNNTSKRGGCRGITVRPLSRLVSRPDIPSPTLRWKGPHTGRFPPSPHSSLHGGDNSSWEQRTRCQVWFSVTSDFIPVYIKIG